MEERQHPGDRRVMVTTETETEIFHIKIFTPSFKARVDPLVCVFRHLYAIDSPESPLVRHLLFAISSRCLLVGLESGIKHAAVSQHLTRQKLYRLSLSKIFIPLIKSKVFLSKMHLSLEISETVYLLTIEHVEYW